MNWLKPYDATPGKWEPKDTAPAEAQSWADELEVPVLLMERAPGLCGALIPCGYKEPA